MITWKEQSHFPGMEVSLFYSSGTVADAGRSDTGTVDLLLQ